MRENIDSVKSTEQLQILLSRFSHELRNPLALLSSGLQLLASSHPELSSDEQWENILGNLEYIHALLDDLSRYQNAGQLSLVLTDLGTCLNEIARSFRPVLEYLEIEFETDIPSDLPKLSLDPLKIRQVCLNLLQNAQESIDNPHGVIRFCAESTADYIHISVCDNGCGMTSSQKMRVFEPFITYKSDGTGLGLAVTRQIIEAHHGFIKIESAPGAGSTFHVYIPLSQPAKDISET
ncbi:MAG: HAMP domain-containing sensor histidine kinase [Eubacteriales bacterium]|nr:HAMP domain-containing sensor histidine kinase [Eubacteriales bacterium]